eukprot:SM000188S03825  [mRNA]  locus=s188:100971:105387:+ [translate_table: standard]
MAPRPLLPLLASLALTALLVLTLSPSPSAAKGMHPAGKGMHKKASRSAASPPPPAGTIQPSLPVPSAGDAPVDPASDPAVLALIPADNIISGGPRGDLLWGDFRPEVKDYAFGNDGGDTIDTGAGADTIFGGLGDDDLYGEHDDDIMVGGPGNDRLIGGPGRDMMWGGDGNDTLNGDAGPAFPNLQWDDLMYGGPGDDFMVGKLGNDEMYGGDGNDRMTGDDGDDLLRGDDGNDLLDGGIGNDDLQGGLGNDTLFGGDGNDIIWGGPGWNIVHGDAGADTYYVNAFPCGEQDSVRTFNPAEGDKLVIVTGTDAVGQKLLTAKLKGISIVGPPNRNVYISVVGCATPFASMGLVSAAALPSIISFAAAGPPEGGRGRLPEPSEPSLKPPLNIIKGQHTTDNLYGFLNDPSIMNFIFGFAFNDFMVGGAGPDIMLGGSGDDAMQGLGGNDRMSGEDGNDILFGGVGDDFLFAGTGIRAGANVLWGGPGSDALIGSPGPDKLYVDAPVTCAATETDTIYNFISAHKIYIVGAYTSLSQLVIGSTGKDATISLPGCAIPFVVVRSWAATALSSTNVLFTTLAGIPKLPMPRYNLDPDSSWTSKCPYVNCGVVGP